MEEGGGEEVGPVGGVPFRELRRSIDAVVERSWAALEGLKARTPSHSQQPRRLRSLSQSAMERRRAAEEKREPGTEEGRRRRRDGSPVEPQRPLEFIRPPLHQRPTHLLTHPSPPPTLSTLSSTFSQTDASANKLFSSITRNGEIFCWNPHLNVDEESLPFERKKKGL